MLKTSIVFKKINLSAIEINWVFLKKNKKVDFSCIAMVEKKVVE